MFLVFDWRSGLITEFISGTIVAARGRDYTAGWNCFVLVFIPTVRYRLLITSPLLVVVFSYYFRWRLIVYRCFFPSVDFDMLWILSFLLYTDNFHTWLWGFLSYYVVFFGLPSSFFLVYNWQPRFANHPYCFFHLSVVVLRTFFDLYCTLVSQNDLLYSICCPCRVEFLVHDFWRV